MPSGLRICHIVTRLDRGGSAENTILTATHQARAGHEVLLIAGSSRESNMTEAERASVNERVRVFEARGGEVIECPPLVREISVPDEARALSSLVRTLRRWRPQVVHTHTSKAGILGRVAARLCRAPWVLHTYHGHVYSGYARGTASRVFGAIERWAAPLAHRLIALTAREMEDHLAEGVGTPEKFCVVPSGVDLTPYRDLPDREAARRALGLPADAVIVGSVGRLTEVKGHRHLVEGLGALEAGIHIALVGDGELRGEITEIAARHGAAHRLHLLGWRPDIPRCLAAFDLFAMPSLNEGMGRAAVEAMAARLPVVGSRVYGLENVVEDGETGLLVPPRDSLALARELNRLRGDRALRDRMARAAPARAQQFSLEKMLAALDELVLEGRERVALAEARRVAS